MAKSNLPFAERLRRWRMRYRLRQQDVAEILGVSDPRISEWEREVRTPRKITQEGIWARLKEYASKSF